VARVVCVHGIGQQHAGGHTLLASWAPALLDGVERAGGSGLGVGQIGMAFYGDLFRPPGYLLAVGDPLFTAADVQTGLEQELLEAWWDAAAVVDSGVVPPDSETLARVPGSVQAALLALSHSRFFAGVALRAMVFDLKQVSRYLTDPQVRAAARERVREAIGADTRVVVAHSLGSVVAYEALCALPGHGVRALVTLGSPLGIRNLVFDRLEPAPGAWPGGAGLTWTNVADAGDVVALVKDLRPAFGQAVVSVVVDNGAHAHDSGSYLTDRLVGAAVAAGLDAG
jgi:pimeloyl-ACP methyl ester carboxylesterase